MLYAADLSPKLVVVAIHTLMHRSLYAKHAWSHLRGHASLQHEQETHVTAYVRGVALEALADGTALPVLAQLTRPGFGPF